MIGNRYWNATRVQNFVKALGGKPTKWAENIAFLAAAASIEIETFLEMDPIAYGITVWGYVDGPYGYKQPHHKIRKVLGVLNYYECYYKYCQEQYESWTKSTDVEHADVEHADVEHADVEHADVEHDDVEHDDVEHETWTQVRVSKFIKALGGRPIDRATDITFLATMASITTQQFLELNPIAYGMMVWDCTDGPYGYKQPCFRIRKILGAQDYHKYYHKYCLDIEHAVSMSMHVT
jgi:hypothetical protein